MHPAQLVLILTGVFLAAWAAYIPWTLREAHEECKADSFWRDYFWLPMVGAALLGVVSLLKPLKLHLIQEATEHVPLDLILLVILLIVESVALGSYRSQCGEDGALERNLVITILAITSATAVFGAHVYHKHVHRAVHAANHIPSLDKPSGFLNRVTSGGGDTSGLLSEAAEAVEANPELLAAL